MDKLTSSSKENKPQHSRAYKISNIIGFVLFFLVIIGVIFYFVSILNSNSSSSLTIAVFKGPVSGATVNIYTLNDSGEKGDLIKGPLTSDASGNVTADLPANLPKRLIIESSGGSYKSESTGQTVQLKNSDTLTAVLPASTKTAAITPFTHMAVSLAKSLIQGGASPDEAVISANETIAKQYGVRSVLDTLPVDASNENASQGNSEAKQYGLLLAGFAQLAKNLGVRSADLANAFAKDWSDGKADGTEDGQPITISNGGALGSASSKGLADAEKQFAESNKNYAGINEGGTSLNNPVATPVGLRIVGASLPAWVSGKHGSYALEAKGGSLPLVWSVVSGVLPDGFSLSKDGILSGVYTLPSGVTKKIFPQLTLEVKDQNGKTQSITLSITVAPETPKITTYNPPTLTVGQSYDEVIAQATGGLLPYTFQREASSGPMPMGMQITTNGHLTGSPKAKGNFSFRVCVVDGADTEKCGSISLTVEQGQEEPAAAAPAAPAKNQPETWQGTITTSGRCECSSASHGCDPYGNGGELTGSFTFTFTLPGSLVQALKTSGPYEPGNPGPGKGTFSGSEIVAVQSNRNDCQLAGGSANNVPITVIGKSSTYYPGFVAMVSFDTYDNPEEQKGLLAGGWLTEHMSNGGSTPGGQVAGMSLLIPSISDTQMSGEASFTDPGTGTFTLTKVK